MEAVAAQCGKCGVPFSSCSDVEHLDSPRIVRGRYVPSCGHSICTRCCIALVRWDAHTGLYNTMTCPVPGCGLQLKPIDDRHRRRIDDALLAKAHFVRNFSLSTCMATGGERSAEPNRTQGSAFILKSGQKCYSLTRALVNRCRPARMLHLHRELQSQHAKMRAVRLWPRCLRSMCCHPPGHGSNCRGNEAAGGGRARQRL
jgi:hypothetical protein